SEDIPGTTHWAQGVSRSTGEKSTPVTPSSTLPSSISKNYRRDLRLFSLQTRSLFLRSRSKLRDCSSP
ncbi:hypothetical protein BGZ81_004294, partial [Podila clonocystis]